MIIAVRAIVCSDKVNDTGFIYELKAKAFMRGRWEDAKVYVNEILNADNLVGLDVKMMKMEEFNRSINIGIEDEIKKEVNFETKI